MSDETNFMIDAFLCLSGRNRKRASRDDFFSLVSFSDDGSQRLSNLDSRFLVALPLVRGLLLCANHLFIAAMATIGKTRAAAAELVSLTHDEAKGWAGSPAGRSMKRSGYETRFR